MKIEIYKNNIIIMIVLILDFLTYINANIYLIFNKTVLPYVNLVFSVYCLISVVKRHMPKKSISYLFIATVYIAVNSIFNNNSLGAISAFLAIYCYIYYFRHCRLSEITYKIILFVGYIYILYFTLNANKIINTFNSGQTILNPNVISMVILFCLVFITSFYNKIFQRKIGKVIIWLLSLLTVYKLKCRTELIVIIIYGILHMWISKKIWKQKKFVLTIVLSIILGGIVFPYIYVQISKNTELSVLAYRLTGKYMFTGRELIWARLIDTFSGNINKIMFGIGSEYAYIIGQGRSMHNSYWQIILNFGLCGLFIFIVFIISQVKNIVTENIKDAQIELLMGYVCVLLVSYTEVILQTPNTVTICAMIIGLACNNSLEKNGEM